MARTLEGLRKAGRSLRGVYRASGLGFDASEISEGMADTTLTSVIVDTLLEAWLDGREVYALLYGSGWSSECAAWSSSLSSML